MRKGKDKIFDNNYEAQEYEPLRGSFTVSSDHNFSNNPEAEIHDTILFEQIHKLVEDSEFKGFNQLDSKGSAVKLNKVQINQVYGYVVNNVKGYRKIEIWSMLSEYFDIYPNKFYSSLSNIFKDALVTEIENSTNYQEKNKIKKLF